MVFGIPPKLTQGTLGSDGSEAIYWVPCDYVKDDGETFILSLRIPDAYLKAGVSKLRTWLRRLIGGRPVFTADGEHIHHKLLQHGMSPGEVLVALYAVSALFALLGLFLLWPERNTLGLALVLIGTGIWFGVQHLGYLEFGEVHRIAQRTFEQRNIFVNNLAIRRATEELKGVSDYAQVCHILKSAFLSNDFDGFELSFEAEGDEPPSGSDTRLKARSGKILHFEKPGVPKFRDAWAAWHLTLGLVTTTNQRRGSMKIYRFYSDRALLVDTNLLTTVFPVVLADALDRALIPKQNVVSEVTNGSDFVAAEAS